jgi:hypothetical protein
MVAAARKTETSPSFTPPPVAEPAPKAQNAMRVELIAIPIIAVVAAFMLLSIKSAILMTAVVTVGAIAYLYGGKTPSPAKPSAIPDELPKPHLPDLLSGALKELENPPCSLNASSILLMRTRLFNDEKFAAITFKTAIEAEAFDTICLNRLADYFYCKKSAPDIYRPGQELNRRELFCKRDLDPAIARVIVEQIKALVFAEKYIIKIGREDGR